MNCLRFSVLIALLISAQAGFAQEDKDYNTCIKKVDYKWGADCKGCTTGGKTYKVRFVNNCTDTLAVKIAVQENHKRWKTYTRAKVLPNDTISGFACIGNGKYLYWAKQFNDNTIEFPSDEEINSSHNK